MAMEATASEGLLGTFHTADINGEPVTQDVFAQSNLTMLNIWGTFCYPCIQEMPDIGQLSEEYKDRMQIIGLISDVTQPEDKGALEIIEYTGANYLHIVNSVDLMNGYVGQVQLVPTTVFLDKEGKQVGSVYTGSQSKSSWERIIKEMLEKVE
ncbi:MAG: TlpA family protein disulfide reductase [Clostridia bacterium]|nr:TlpA family protein disulfide reductase [Clostridia bacterium]NCD01666.1 TlpA family protein disulfide reductase [Clostridia bacterium]